jgi:phage terminase small subunit
MLSIINRLICYSGGDHMGRPRKPVDELKSYRPSRNGPRTVPCSKGANGINSLKEPGDLNVEAVKIWRSLVGILGDRLQATDGLYLAAGCRWWAELGRIQKAIESMVPGEKGYGSLVVAAGIATDKVKAIVSQFGLSPADRARLPTINSLAAKTPTRPQTKIDQMGPPSNGPDSPVPPELVR